MKSWINSVHFGSDTSCSFFPLLLYSACLYSSRLFSISGALSSSLFVVSFPFSFLLCLCNCFLTALARRFLSNSWYRSCCDKIKSWVNSVHLGSDTSCSFFPLPLPCLSLFFPTLFNSLVLSDLLYLLFPLSLLYSVYEIPLFNCISPMFPYSSLI